jgi:hypothetical protein
MRRPGLGRSPYLGPRGPYGSRLAGPYRYQGDRSDWEEMIMPGSDRYQLLGVSRHATNAETAQASR